MSKSDYSHPTTQGDAKPRNTIKFLSVHFARAPLFGVLNDRLGLLDASSLILTKFVSAILLANPNVASIQIFSKSKFLYKFPRIVISEKLVNVTF